MYRTVTTYQLNKQRFVNDVQLALDLSVEKYYADKARRHFSVMTMSDGDSITTQVNSIALTLDSLALDSEIVLVGDTTFSHRHSNGFQYAWSSGDEDVQVRKELKRFRTDSGTGTYLRMSTGEDTTDSFEFAFADFTQLTQKIMISSSEERIDIKSLTDILEEELGRRSLSMDYNIRYLSRRGESPEPPDYPLFASAKSTYLMPGESLSIFFENATLQILKRGAVDLIISFLIVFCVIGALLYLYRIIQNQKELAMVKDDLIGNVTHEFKTPIATVSTALEGIANFNQTNDPEKTKRYVEMSREQLTKLNLMVEKLMETATIDSGEIEINKVETNVTELVQKVSETYQLKANGKSFAADLPGEEIWHEVDPFHLENILTNLLDNAFKYGGDQVSLSMRASGQKLDFRVIDNGGEIEKTHQQKIFEKLYRIPRGNQHDVKGFGIGLYYTKSMVEKHGGRITLDVSPKRTCFTVTL